MLPPVIEANVDFYTAISAVWDSDIASTSSVLALDTAATRAFFHFSLDFPRSDFDFLFPSFLDVWSCSEILKNAYR
jgi:hypothetical protein